MMTVTIFGKDYRVTDRKSNKDSVRVEGKEIFVMNCTRSADSLLEEFLTDLLYSKLFKITDQIGKSKKVEVLGDLDFEVVGKIDGKKQRVAKLKGNKILVKLNAISLPVSALKYIIAHELAHLFTKKHGDRFWKMVKTIYPSFKRGQELLSKYDRFLV